MMRSLSVFVVAAAIACAGPALAEGDRIRGDLPIVPAEGGWFDAVPNGATGDVLDVSDPGAGSGEVQVHNDLGQGTINASIYKNGQRLSSHNLTGAPSADIVMTGGGPGQSSTPFNFNLDNVDTD